MIDRSETTPTFVPVDRDSDGYNVFTIDPITGMIRTKAVLDHEERNVYRVSVKATDAGRPPRHSIRALRVEVLALADNRPTFTSSSLTFNVSIAVRTSGNFFSFALRGEEGAKNFLLLARENR